MRHLLLFALVLSFGFGVYAQQRVVLPVSVRDQAVKMDKKMIKDLGNMNSEVIPGSNYKTIVSDEQVGETRYDLQTNQSTQNRIYMYDDGTMGVTWNMGFDEPGFAQRGTGYNYFDGNSWGPEPTARVENTKTGWPSYTNYGENGEIFVAHHMTQGLLYGTRTQKGTGTWAFDIQAGPTGAVDISWPRVITTGADNDIIHFLSVTYALYNGQTNALLYSRSDDGGATWDPENHSFPEFGSALYTNIGGDVYEFAEPKNGILAFLVGDPWVGLHLMKSTDDGDTWAKTTIWECPYPLNAGLVTDTFYNADGSHHLAIDNTGKIHVVFGINRAYSDGAGSFWFPGVDGVGYWNEDMPTFSSDLNALNPYGHPDSELIEDVNLIGWSQDVNGNGELDLLTDWGTYYLGLSSMVQIVIDDLGQIIVLFSSVTEGYDNGIQNFRHIWARGSNDLGTTWGPFLDLNSDLVYIFDECIVPSVAANSDDNIYFAYQADNEPGMAVQGDEDPYGDNYIRVMTVLKEDIIDGIGENQAIIGNHNVSQNFPNPFDQTTSFHVVLDMPADVGLEVTNLMGQRVYTIPAQRYQAGKTEMVISAEGLNPGVYFYTVRSGDDALQKK
jgi:hypothetical protein